MKKTCHYGLLIQLKIRKDNCNTERMNDIRFTGFTFLILMCLAGHFKSLVEQSELLGRNPWGHGIEYSRSPLVDNLVVILVHGVVRG